MVGYQLGIDLGTTFTAAALVRGDQVEIVSLGDRRAAGQPHGVRRSRPPISVPTATNAAFVGRSLTFTEAVTSAGENVGLFVSIYYSVVDEAPPVPTGAGAAKQFLGSAPTAPQMAWQSTELTARGGEGLSAAPPSGSYVATWSAPPGDKDAVIAFLSDPANVTVDYAIVTPGGFADDSSWVQEVTYLGFAGEYVIYLDPSGTADITVTLTFDLLQD